MSESERYGIQHHYPRGLRPESYTVRFTDPADISRVVPRHRSEDEAREWAERYLAAKDAGQLQAARKTTPPAPERARTSTALQVDRQATQVASILGLPLPAASTGCHYCGLPLRKGQCGECG